MTAFSHSALLKKICGSDAPPAPGEDLRLVLELCSDEGTERRFLAESLDESPRLCRRFLIAVNHLLPTTLRVSNGRSACETLERNAIQEALWIQAISDVMHAAHDRSRNRLWKHSLLTAMIVRELAAHLSIPPQGLLLPAAMAHDVGHLLIWGPATDSGIDWHAEHDRLVDQDQEPLPERNHCLIGAGLLQSWNAPQELIEAAAHHHHPQNAAEPVRTLIAVVSLADLIAEHVDAEQNPSELSLETSTAWTILNDSAGLSSSNQEQLLADMLIPASIQADRLAGLLS